MWPRLNTSAIQVIGTVVGVFATVVLACATVVLAWFTKTLASAAIAQSRAQAEAAKARRRELRASVQLLLSALNSLPFSNATGDRDEAMRHSIKWNDFDFGRLRTLASEVSPRAAECAADAQAKMQLLADRVNSGKGVPARSAFDWGPYPFPKQWDETIQETRESLDQISRDSGEAR